MITGTFLDEITHDIPSQNWGKHEWAQDFDAMKAIGIDTVILIRAGYRQLATFDSKVLKAKVNQLPAYIDLVDIYLTEAERCGMKFYFGTYDSGDLWNGGHYQAETDINKAFCDEVMERYGHRNAFHGWYITHEINTFNDGMMQVYEDLSAHLKSLKNVPILISPYVKGSMQFGSDAISLDQHIHEWEQVFQRIESIVDIVAFQDGQVPIEELKDYLQANAALAKKYNMISWSNVESFERGHPIKFPPLDFRKLRYKMEQAQAANVEKLITFEFSHFMSPNSMWESARQLYKRYQEWMAMDNGNG